MMIVPCLWPKEPHAYFIDVCGAVHFGLLEALTDPARGWDLSTAAPPYWDRRLLDWIRDEVIGNRRTRAFLLAVGTSDETIDRLFDRRALHIESGTSSAHRPGERFVVYKLDYGCYADLKYR